MKVVENSPLNYWIIFQRAKLEGNDRADINASDAISGNIIRVPDITFVQNRFKTEITEKMESGR
ncbi:hypothetical protein [Nostoc sp. LPT]|uniref:hypothetical protein n=1 Tax=Nostoc sp. LPT TaxID=2815387 RepID=UPI001D52ED20|nr:hypothetical protein [Nostoc sp. LPT]MBN4003276.1 hypothetical protein [Nostoc sp. LPT]